MRAVFVFLCLLCINLSANDGFVPDDTGFVPNEEKDLSLESKKNIRISQSLFVSYVNVPNKGYVNAYIPLRIKAIVARKFQYLKVVNPDKKDSFVGDFISEWEKKSENVYEKTIFFKAKKALKKLPPLQVEFIGKKGVLEKSYLPSKAIDIVRLNNDEGRFINVFAESLQVKKIKTNRFDEDNLIMVLEINAQNSNLEDIEFQEVVRQGLDTKMGDYFDSTVFYFIIFPKEKLNIHMSYFNTIKNDFHMINLPVKIEKDDLSTQVDLNPKKSQYELYKEIFMVVLALSFLVVFYFRRRYAYIVLAFVFLGYSVYMNLSISTVYIYENTRVRILPTENSTIFYTTTGTESAEKLSEVKPYIKVLLPNKKIGWIKDEDVIKD